MLSTTGGPEMREWLIVVMTLLAGGCALQAQPEPVLDDYTRRLARVLDVELQPSPVPAAPRLPGPRERLRTIEPISIGLLEFLGLFGCELQQVVGERNSGLGRVAHPLTRLDYERRFLLAAEACLPGLEGEPLGERLVEVTELKRAGLADAAWNAVWASREIEQHFSRARGPLPMRMDSDAISTSAQNAALLERRIRGLLAGELQQDLGALDAVYQRWQADPLAGQALRSVVLLRTRLDDASHLLEQRLGQRPLCPQGRPNRQAEILRNVFGAVYAAEVQPYLASLQRVRHELFPPLHALAEAGHGSPSPVFSAFIDTALDTRGARGPWRDFDQAIARHTAAWQALLEQCGMAPGSSAAQSV